MQPNQPKFAWESGSGNPLPESSISCQKHFVAPANSNLATPVKFGMEFQWQMFNWFGL